jgi:hypothetical protein
MCGALAVFQPCHDKRSVAALILQDLQSSGRQLPVHSLAELNESTPFIAVLPKVRRNYNR